MLTNLFQLLTWYSSIFIYLLLLLLLRLLHICSSIYFSLLIVWSISLNCLYKTGTTQIDYEPRNFFWMVRYHMVVNQSYAD